MKKNILKLVILYILGLVLYTAVLYLTQTIILNGLDLAREEVNIFLDNPIINVILYTLLFAFITFMLYVYDKTSVKELNAALIEMKERVKANEKQIRSNRNDNNYSSNSDIGSVWNCEFNRNKG